MASGQEPADGGPTAFRDGAAVTGTAVPDGGSATVPKLFVMTGLPGVGKSTVAKQIARRHDATVIRSDEVRKELFPDPEYTEAETVKVYRGMFARAVTRLDAGEVVVLDATFRNKFLRDEAATVAKSVGAGVEFVRVECDEDVAKQRIRSRSDDASDATVENYETIRREFHPLERDHRTVDNTEPRQDLTDPAAD